MTNTTPDSSENHSPVNSTTSFATPFERGHVAKLDTSTRNVEDTSIHEDKCYRIRYDHDSIRDVYTYRLYCGFNVQITIPASEAAMLLSNIPDLDKMPADTIRDFSPLLPISWQWVKGDKGTEKRLCSISYVAPTVWYEDGDKWKRFQHRCNAGAEYIESVLGSNRSLWPGEADSLSLVKQQQAKDYVASNPKKFGKPDPLIEEFKAKGAEVEIEDTPPLPISGGTGEDKPVTDEPKVIERRARWTCEHLSGMAQVMACLNHFKRVVLDSFPNTDVYKLIITVLDTDVESSIDKRGIEKTVDILQAYLDKFGLIDKAQEEDLATKTKPAATEEAPAPVRPTTEEIDAARKRISEMGIKTAEDFKAATGYDNIPAAIQAGEALKTVENSAWMWAIENDKKQPAESTAKEAISAPSGDEGPIAPEKVNEPQAQDIPRSEPTNITPIINIRTITGINILNIQGELNKPLPPEAYQSIDYGVMKGKTDLDGNYVRERFDQVFGPMGVGWRIVPNTTAGRVEYKTEQRGDKTWHVVSLIAHTFQYSVIMPDGSLSWTDASTTSDLHDNVDQQYAYRGAMTSIMKQFFSLMGGMNHIRHNVYTHVHAQRDLARRKSA